MTCFILNEIHSNNHSLQHACDLRVFQHVHKCRREGWVDDIHGLIGSIWTLHDFVGRIHLEAQMKEFDSLKVESLSVAE